MALRSIRWTPHAVKNLIDREIDRTEAEKTVASPEYVERGRPPRSVYMRRYVDEVLLQEMLLRIVVEDGPDELVVVTVYKTSRIERYLREVSR